MCSIFGIGFLRGHKEIGTTLLSTLIDNLIICNENFNKSATGISFVNKHGISVVKKNITAEEFINLESYEETKEGNIKDENSLYSIVGHCRMETKGTHKINHNNHPIIREELIGTHNGMISNDEDLFYNYKSIKRNGLVDSEIIFAIIEHFLKINEDKLYTKSEEVTLESIIKTAISKIEGSFACSMVLKSQPHLVWLFRNNNPCNVLLYKKAGLLFWATCKTDIEDAVSKSKITQFLGTPTIIDVPVKSGVCIDLHRNKLKKFYINPKENYHVINGKRI